MMTSMLRRGGLFLVVLLLLFGPRGLQTDSLSLAAEAQELQKVTLKVEGMECKSCVKDIRKALLKIPGVKNANVRIVSMEEKTGEAVVECEKGKVIPDQLVKAVEDASNAMFTYKASVIAEK